jgi:hypothetical protein
MRLATHAGWTLLPGDFILAASVETGPRPTIARSLYMLHRKMNALILSLVLVFTGFSMQATAAVIATQDALSMDARELRIAAIGDKLARDDVRQAMIELGVDPQQAQLRVASLTDAELQQLDGQLDQLPAGGSALAVIGIVFVVLMILEFTGVIDIFKKA